MKKLLATIAIFFMCVSTSVMGSQTPSKDDIENTIKIKEAERLPLQLLSFS